VIVSGGQTQLGDNDQELLPCGAMRQSVAGKDVTTEVEDSTELGAVTKHRLAKRQHIEKT
jgi:hypothetical protein